MRHIRYDLRPLVRVACEAAARRRVLVSQHCVEGEGRRVEKRLDRLNENALSS
jgi:hypothetical protein